MVFTFREVLLRMDQVEKELGQVKLERDQLVQAFDASLGKYRLPFRLRRRSGGQIFWRNTASRPERQRDKPLSEYAEILAQLPGKVVGTLLTLEKKRLICNANFLLLQHEKRNLMTVTSQLQLIESIKGA